jgi:release factor glutamine methyltransferase
VSGKEGTEYHQELVRSAKYLLRSGGWLVMEIGAGHAEAVKEMITRDDDYGDVLFHRDLGGIERVVSARKEL